MNVGNRIKKIREEKRISQTELAEKTASSKQTIYKYENGIVTNIPSDKVELIAKVLEVTPAYLMGWEDVSVIKNNDSLNVYVATTDEEKEIETLRPFFESVGFSLSSKLNFNKKGKIESVTFSIQNEEYFYTFNYSDLKILKDNLTSYTKFQINEILNKAIEKIKK